ncbi:MAG: TrmH family RNA methyltransferase [bacterium]|nr:TrmH family RNA methyltransferase [bacterium]
MKYVLLHDIRSVHNVGSIFRTADGAGISKIYLSGCSPTPLDRFGQPRKDFIKVSLGAEKSVAWEYIDDPIKLIKDLKKEVKIVAVEQDEKSLSYLELKDKIKNSSTLYIFGNEVGGVPKDILKYADYIAEIPMKGDKESLNVSVTAGIILFSL